MQRNYFTQEIDKLYIIRNGNQVSEVPSNQRTSEFIVQPEQQTVGSIRIIDELEEEQGETDLAEQFDNIPVEQEQKNDNNPQLLNQIRTQLSLSPRRRTSRRTVAQPLYGKYGNSRSPLWN